MGSYTQQQRNPRSPIVIPLQGYDLGWNLINQGERTKVLALNRPLSKQLTFGLCSLNARVPWACCWYKHWIHHVNTECGVCVLFVKVRYPWFLHMIRIPKNACLSDRDAFSMICFWTKAVKHTEEKQRSSCRWIPEGWYAEDMQILNYHFRQAIVYKVHLVITW